MENTEILAIYGTEYKEMTKRLLEEADLASRIPDQECHIGIKPNLVSPSEPSWGATTHPEIVAGIIEYLQERGFKDLVILEGSWVGDKTEDTARLCGYYDLSEKYGVEFLDMQKDSIVSSIHSVTLDPENLGRVVHVWDVENVSVNGAPLPIGGYLDIGLYDTMKDLAVTFIGSVTYSLFGFFYLTGKSKGHFFRKFILTWDDEGEKE